MADIDLRSINLGDAQLASFARKRDAVAFAKKTGWPIKDSVRSAYNRFSKFWVIGQFVCDDLRLMKRDGSIMEIRNPGLN